MVSKEEIPKTALLVCDLQNGIVQMMGDANKHVLTNTQKAIETARKHNIPVIYIKVKFREGCPEVSPNNKMFSMISKMGNMVTDENMTEVHESIKPKKEDIVVVKKRVSSFAGSDLEVILRSKGLTSLVLCGLSTSGVILSTVREAADKDFKLVVLSDCCADTDDEVHNVLVKKVFARQADVFTVDEWSSQVDK